MRYLVVLLMLFPLLGQAQRYFTRSGEVVFFSSTPVEDIEAQNTSVRSVLDASSGAIQFSALMKSFVFEKALMQEHFNENYVESDDYPKAIFKGKITNLSSVNFDKPGTYSVKIVGTMTLHGVTKPLEVEGQLLVESADKIEGTCSFIIEPETYQIRIPSLVRDKIAKEIKVSVKMNYQIMKK